MKTFNSWVVGSGWWVLGVVGCSGGANLSNDAAAIQSTVGAEGGELIGPKGTALDGVRLVIPPGALAQSTEIRLRPAASETALPETAVRVGAQFTVEPAGLALAKPATLTLPFDEATVTDQMRFADEVKVWTLQQNGWNQQQQTESTDGLVTIDVERFTTFAAGVHPPGEDDIVQFTFTPIAKWVDCLAQYPNDPNRQPSVQATVVRGALNDGLFLKGKYIKPKLAFDLFTVQRSNLRADATPDPDFKSFGLVWYQTNLEANHRGDMRVSIRSVLLDQIFGFDLPDLPPTGTYQVGFWFNDPEAAAACGFDATKPTPFNGERKAGPLAMITLPDPDTGLGPLCTKPDTSVVPAKCSP